ncbi:MAG: hypothetical protein JW726_09890 [Anaerolineales bacterium]|nr:hypothetical protein [Anaerolineales bacterium]
MKLLVSQRLNERLTAEQIISTFPPFCNGFCRLFSIYRIAALVYAALHDLPACATILPNMHNLAFSCLHHHHHRITGSLTGQDRFNQQ